MGNTESNVTSGVKKQADTSSIQMYKLVDLKGGGTLVELMKRAAQNKQYAELDHAIKTKVEPFLYNKGEGRLIPIAKLVLLRNKDRPRTKMLPPLKNMENPDDFDVIGSDIPGIPDPKPGDDPSTYRDVCWDLNERGAVGETILHLCLLNATSLHADLAKRLLKFYPKLINDIYMCDEYYGESVLHIAIVNEDPSMVKFLLDSGADYHERCFGNFMCPEDQKGSRTDSFDHEWVNLIPFTNYEGYVYWGEYPLTFAACLGQEECYRLMLSRGANPDNQDTNGNTVLHMLVIYEKLPTFDMAYELGANVSIRNVQNLTTLTLAAKLARIEMFFHILNIEREIYWQIGSITCAAYPLGLIDTIDIETGNISKDSALNLVVFGDKDEHLELMDGVLVDLLHAKWNSFVKFRFYRQFSMFFIYFLISLICFTLRPGPLEKNMIDLQNATLMGGSTVTNPLKSTNEMTITPTTMIPNDISLTNNVIIQPEKYIDLSDDNRTTNETSPFYLDNDDFNLEKQISESGRLILNNINLTNKENHLDVQNFIKIEMNVSNNETQINKLEQITHYSTLPSTIIQEKILNEKQIKNETFDNISQNIFYKTLFNRTMYNISNSSNVKPVFTIENNVTLTSQNEKTNKSDTTRPITNVKNNSNNNDDEVELFPNYEYEIIKTKKTDNNPSGLIQPPQLMSKLSSSENGDTNNIFHYSHNRNTNRNNTVTSTTMSVVKNIILSPLPTIKTDLNSFIREGWWDDFAGDCPLLQVHDSKDAIRLIAEVALEVGSFLYLLAALREARFLGLNMMIENLMTAPSRVMFLFSCCLMMGMPFLRFSCYDEVEDIVAVVIMLTTAPYFLFFCRGFKTVGPFVVMIYRMVMGDLLRFVSIYLVFVMGFSQAYYIIFLSFDNPTTPDGIDDTASNPLPNPVEAVMAMFFMSLTNFGDYYSAFEKTDHEVEAKVFFVIYMAIVAILLVNMLIAMMGNTYQKIAETRNEWQRQWARIVLVVERGVSPSERLKKLMSYSQPMSDGRRALVLRLNQTEEDKEEMKEILEMKRVHDKLVLKRKRGKRLLGTDTPSPKRLVEISSPKPTIGAL